MSSFVYVQYCYDLLISQISAGLLLYAHIPTALCALAFGTFLIIKARKNLSSVPLFLLCVSFAIWCFLNLGAWFAFLGSRVTMFTWSLIDLFSVLFFFFSYYFLYTFIKEKDLPLWQKALGFLTLVPNLYFTLTSINLNTFDLNWCEAIETDLATNFAVYIEQFYLLFIIGFIIKEYFSTKEKKARTKIALSGTGVTVFLFIFFLGLFSEILVSTLGILPFSYNVEIYGLFGMPLLLVFLGLLIVKEHAFNIKMFATQALVIALVALVAAQFAFAHDAGGITLTAVTLVLVSWVGLSLARSVKKEIEQREKIEKLAVDLEKANVRLQELDTLKSEFLSFASHQLRSPLTALHGYTSMLLEGDFGEMSGKVTSTVETIDKSSNSLIKIVNDFLNISRIEQGRMEYDLADFNLKELVEEVISEQRPNVEEKGLELSFNAEPAPSYLINADRGKLKQVIGNVLDNSIKYSPVGSIKVNLNRKNTSSIVSIADTGIGIDPEEIPKLFSKFSRAKDANKTNVTGTGLGLYVAKQMIEAQKGKIWVESEGKGKGSTFFIEFEAK